MDCGTQFMSTVNRFLGSEIKEMHISLVNGTQIQVKEVPMGEDTTTWMVSMLTYDNPYWATVAAGESPALALTTLCRMVGATDTDQ